MMNQVDIDPVETQFKLANLWQIRGKFTEARARYQEILAIDPNFFPAYQQLGNLLLKQQQNDEAIEYLERALTIDFDRTDLSFYYQCLGLKKHDSGTPVDRESIAFSPSSQGAMGKINLGAQRVFGYHRSGWSFALQSLAPIHNPDGILFDGTLENQFFSLNKYGKHRSPPILAKMRADGVFDRLASLLEKGILPYQKPWVGFIHNPQGMPSWFSGQTSLQQLFKQSVWQDSLPNCIGLFSLSEYNASWLRAQTGKPVSALIHPTEIPDRQFDFQSFLDNPHKKIVQIGWWLRKLNSLDLLPLDRYNSLGYEKVRIGNLFDACDSITATLMKVEKRLHHLELDAAYTANTRTISYIPDDRYDELLSTNIAFVDLYDSSANNAIIECIARATPLLVNPLPAVKEYLGEDYPMYFTSLTEAATKALDTALILDTHRYLKSCEIRQKLSAAYFRDSFCQSEVYQMI
jgi:tetratricopeptide (TPR) repeat protein